MRHRLADIRLLSLFGLGCAGQQSGFGVARRAIKGQIGEKVGQFLRSDQRFQILGHEGNGASLDFFNLGPGNDFFLAALNLEFYGFGAVLCQQAGEGAAIFHGHHHGLIIFANDKIRVKDIRQKLVVVVSAIAGDVGADFLAIPCNTAHTYFEEIQSAVPIPVLHMILAGLICTAVYKWLKARTLRPRPYQLHSSIRHFIAPLDRFSFPSGHTLHAVAFSLIAAGYYPGLGAALAVFSMLIAASRVVLGLHYPSDVIAGAVIGAVIALASQALAG